MAIKFLKMDNAPLSQNTSMRKLVAVANPCWVHKPTAMECTEITPVVGRLP